MEVGGERGMKAGGRFTTFFSVSQRTYDGKHSKNPECLLREGSACPKLCENVCVCVCVCDCVCVCVCLCVWVCV